MITSFFYNLSRATIAFIIIVNFVLKNVKKILTNSSTEVIFRISLCLNYSTKTIAHAKEN